MTTICAICFLECIYLSIYLCIYGCRVLPLSPTCPTLILIFWLPSPAPPIYRSHVQSQHTYSRHIHTEHTADTYTHRTYSRHIHTESLHQLTARAICSGDSGYAINSGRAIRATSEGCLKLRPVRFSKPWLWARSESSSSVA